MIQIRNIFFLVAATILVLGSSCENPIDALGSVRVEFSPVVETQAFAGGDIYTSPAGRQYRINFFRMYVSDISLIKEDGTEVLLSEVDLYDLAADGSGQDFGQSYTYADVEAGTYKGIKFGIGLPARLNTDPASYAVDHPLSIGNQMYWSWRAGYRFISIEGKVDSSQAMSGAELRQSFGYHIGKDSVNSPNNIYYEMVYDGPDDGFTLAENEEFDIEFSVDVNEIFFNQTSPIDLVSEAVSHSVPGEQFDLSVRIAENLVNYALTKKPL
ncbi:MAG: MbnP family protein [Bacteroidota bacterium]